MTRTAKRDSRSHLDPDQDLMAVVQVTTLATCLASHSPSVIQRMYSESSLVNVPHLRIY